MIAKHAQPFYFRISRLFEFLIRGDALNDVYLFFSLRPK